VVGTLLAGCDLTNEPGLGSSEENQTRSLFAKSDAENEGGPWLHIAAQVPSLACEAGERAVEDDPLVDDARQIVPARTPLADAGNFGPVPATVFDNSQVSTHFQGNLPSDPPPWWRSNNYGPFESDEDEMVKLDGRVNISLIGTDQENIYSSDAPRSGDVDVGVEKFEGPGIPTDVLNVRQEIDKKSIFGSFKFSIIFGYPIYESVRGSSKQNLPNLGRIYVDFTLPEGSKFIPALKEASSKGDKIKILDEGSENPRFRVTSDRTYAMLKTGPEIVQEGVEDATETFSQLVLGLELVAAAGPIAAMALQAGGAGGAALALLGIQLEVLPAIAGRVTPFPGAGASAAAKAAAIGGTGYFVPEEETEGGVPRCEYMDESYDDRPMMDVPLSGSTDRRFLDGLSGPLVIAEAEEPSSLKPRPAGQRVAYGEVRLSPSTVFTGENFARQNERSGNMIAFSGNTAGEVGFEPVTEIRRIDDLENSRKSDSDVVKSSVVDDGLTDVGYSSVAWGQVDGSSDSPDLIVSGFKAGGFEPSTRLYENNGGNFESVGAGLVDVGQGDVSWADFDGDGRQDILVSGFQERESGATDPVTKLYRDTGDGFERMNADLVGVGAGEAAWADFDGDGDLDLVVTGRDDNREPVTQLYENIPEGFTPRSSPLPDVDLSSVAWGDYNGDGHPDLAIAGRTANGSSLVELYRNDGGSLSLAFDSPIGVERGDLDWADYDSDGDLDLALSGLSVENNSPVTALVENTSSSESSIFGDVKFFSGASLSSVDWGDMGNDGAPDLIVSGLGSAEDNESDYKSPKTVVLENKEE